MASQEEGIEVRAPGLAVDFVDVSKEYLVNGNPLKALSSITLNVREGEVAAIVGPSGAGKTTVLNIIAALEKASQREPTALGLDVNAQYNDSRSAFRSNNRRFSF